MIIEIGIGLTALYLATKRKAPAAKSAQAHPVQNVAVASESVKAPAIVEQLPSMDEEQVSLREKVIQAIKAQEPTYTPVVITPELAPIKLQQVLAVQQALQTQTIVPFVEPVQAPVFTPAPVVTQPAQNYVEPIPFTPYVPPTVTKFVEPPPPPAPVEILPVYSNSGVTLKTFKPVQITGFAGLGCGCESTGLGRALR